MEISNELTPEECSSMSDIRTEIDFLDRAIISLIGQRSKYLEAATKLQTPDLMVRSPEQIKTMLLQRREWANAEGVDPDIIEKIYTDLVHHFLQDHLKATQPA
ncbi:MAG TPA: chorismate mutase [Cellvibrio sp.]